jgi:hypothetical protein
MILVPEPPCSWDRYLEASDPFGYMKVPESEQDDRIERDMRDSAAFFEWANANLNQTTISTDKYKEALKKLAVLDTYGIHTDTIASRELDEMVELLLDNDRLLMYWGEPLPQYIVDELNA